MTEKYYLIVSEGCSLPIGTVIKRFKKDFINCDTENKAKCKITNLEIQNVCIEIGKKFKEYLINKNIDERVDIYKKIKEFEQNDICLYTKGGQRTECVIVSTKDDSIKLKSQNHKEITINWHEIHYLSLVEKGGDQEPKKSLSSTKFSASIVSTDKRRPSFTFYQKSPSIITDKDFVDEIYLRKDFEMKNLPENSNDDMLGTLVQVNDTRPIYGRVRTSFQIKNEVLVGIEIDLDYLHTHHVIFMNVPIHDNIIDGRSGIIVNKKSINKFDDPLLLIDGGVFVDMESVKVNEKYKSDLFKIDDIVMYRGATNEQCYGKVKIICKLNDVACLGLENFNCTNQRNYKYIREDFCTFIPKIPGSPEMPEDICESYDVIEDPERSQSANIVKGSDNCDGQKDQPIEGTSGRRESINSTHCLIKIDEIKTTCNWYFRNLLGSHNSLIMNNNGSFIVKSICCVEKSKINKFNPKIEIGFRIKKIQGHCTILGICRWIGLVNGTKSIGVEIVQCPNDNCDQFIGTYLFFDNLAKIVLFKYEDFHPDPESEILNKDDIVKYETAFDKYFGRVLNVTKKKGVSYVEVVNSIDPKGDEQKRTFKKDEIIKIRMEDYTTKYLDFTVIDPSSVVSLRPSNDRRFAVKDEVEFTVQSMEFQGKILFMVEINFLQCAIVELTHISAEVTIAEYLITYDLYVKLLKEMPSLPYKDNVIVVLTALKKIPEKILHCAANNNVPILNPARVKIVNTTRKEDKTIIFKCYGNRIVAQLKWRGNIDGDECIGCEMKYKFMHGTSGVFGTSVLFKCKEGHGALILLDTIFDCCVRPEGWLNTFKSLMISPHVTLGVIHINMILGSTICCVEPLNEFRNRPELKIGCRVMDMDNKIFGYCRWMGVVNNKDVIGVEMVHCVQGNSDKDIDELALFDNPDNKIVLFLLGDFKLDKVGHCYCSKNDLIIVDHDVVKVVKGGKILSKTIVYKYNDNIVSMNIKWKGIVNGQECIGSEMNNKCVCGTNVEFNGNKLFDCINGNGVLIPVNRLIGSCESGSHKEVCLTSYGSVATDSICCYEQSTKINKWPSMETGSKVIYRSDCHYGGRIGNCRWMGCVNGRESIGVNMKDTMKREENNKYPISNIFDCKKDRGSIFTVDIIIHDVEGEKLLFMKDKIVDVRILWKVKNNNIRDKRGMKEGDYVYINLNVGNGDQMWSGELKWMGMINNIECAGVDLEDLCEYGMNGVIKEVHRFKCLDGHGIVTIFEEVHKFDSVSLRLTNDGLVDANKYLQCEEKWDEDSLVGRNVSRNGLVFVIIDNNGCKWKRRGRLQWCGIMNGSSVAIVELDQDYHNGTNGTFWRHRLIECLDKKAVAVPWENVFEYIPFEKMDIPDEIKIFKQIGVNSAVLLYMPQNNVIKNLYGTVKWSGINEFDEYIYGIELDDRYSGGTDGMFQGQRLFQCQNQFGILANLKEVLPDERFVQLDLSDEDIKESEICDTYKDSIPVRNFYGENYGIQGNANSCYFDSAIFALFSKSDVLDFMIHSTINNKEKDAITKKFRNIMAYSIVFPLREFGFVSFHKTKQMREVIKGYGSKFIEMTKHESDMENVAALLAKLSPSEQLLRLTTFSDTNMPSINNSMFLQLFVILDNPVKYISSQQMLDISMVQNMIMFHEAPTCLIMQAPRDAKGINCYDSVLPSRVIEISKLCYQSYKKCSKCNNMAAWQCRDCAETNLRVESALLCDDHKCGHKNIVSVPNSMKYSHSHVQLILKAIICIEKAHFVAYVKEDEFKQEWVFFDSMSTQSSSTNYSVPKVTKERDVSDFLKLNETQMEKILSGYPSSELRRIVKDSYIFVYHNSAKTCY